MALKEVAPGIERVGQFPLPMVNVYLAGDILFDAGTTWDRFRIPRQIKDRQLTLLTLTPDEARAELIAVSTITGTAYETKSLKRYRVAKQWGAGVEET